MHITLHLILISLISGGVFANSIPPICCFPKQFESLMFATNTGVENGRGFFGLDFAFTNGTIRTAYDLVNMRTYMLSKYLMEEEDPQENMEWNVTIVQDYKNNEIYQVFLGVLCQSGLIGWDLLEECIPGNATMVSEGHLGDSVTAVRSYLLYQTLDDTGYQMVVTVAPSDTDGECIPVRMSITTYPPDSGASVLVAEVSDVTKGIKDPSIFNKPPQCQGTPRSGVYADSIPPICCFPKQFESLMFATNTGVKSGRGYFGLDFSLANGTIRTAYDLVNRRTYMLSKYLMENEDPQENLEVNVTTVQDYKNNKSYQVFLGVLCESGLIDRDLFEECIPGNATMVSEGHLGASATPVRSYQTLAVTGYQMVVTVAPSDTDGECIPVRMSITTYPPDSGAGVLVAEVSDVTKGIKDPSIFDKPAQCQGTPRTQSDLSHH